MIFGMLDGIPVSTEVGDAIEEGVVVSWTIVVGT